MPENLWELLETEDDDKPTTGRRAKRGGAAAASTHDVGGDGGGGLTPDSISAPLRDASGAWYVELTLSAGVAMARVDLAFIKRFSGEAQPKTKKGKAKAKTLDEVRGRR